MKKGLLGQWPGPHIEFRMFHAIKNTRMVSCPLEYFGSIRSFIWGLQDSLHFGLEMIESR